jgi:hypothetical protein
MASLLFVAVASLPSGFVAPPGLSPPVFAPPRSAGRYHECTISPVDCSNSKDMCYAKPFQYNLTSAGATRVYFSVDGSDPSTYFTNKSCVPEPGGKAGCISTLTGTALMPPLSAGRVLVRAIAASIKGNKVHNSSESCATYEVRLPDPSFVPAGCRPQGDPASPKCPTQPPPGSSCTFQVTQICSHGPKFTCRIFSYHRLLLSLHPGLRTAASYSTRLTAPPSYPPTLLQACESYYSQALHCHY